MRRLFERWLAAPREEAPAISVSAALLTERPSDIFMAWARDGSLKDRIPDLEALRGISQLPAHREDAFIHTLKVVDAIEATPVRRWAALLHDIGKGPTFIETPEGRSRFFNHELVGAAMVEELMHAAGEEGPLVSVVQKLVSLHMRPISYSEEWNDSAVRRLMEDAAEGQGSEGWLDLLALARADLRGYLPEPIDRGLWVIDSLEARANSILASETQEAVERELKPRSPLDGNDILALAGRAPGPWVGALKDYLTALVVAGRLEQYDRVRAEDLARRWLDQHPSD